MYTTTLKEIKSFGPCDEGWKKLRKSLPLRSPLSTVVSYLHILESNGIDDAIWSLRTNKQLAVKLAVAYAEAVLPVFEQKYPADSRPRTAIETAKKWLADPSEENRLACRTAAYDAYAANAAADAAYDAYAANAAADAAYDAYAAADAAANADTAAAGLKFDKVEIFKQIVGSSEPIFRVV